MNKNKQRKFPFQKQTALILTGALLAGILPAGTGTGSQAAEQPALRSTRLLETTHEVTPGSDEKKELKNPVKENDVTVWDCVWFGNYWQDDTNGDGKADKNDDKTPIKWRVLSVEGDDAFLMADKNLDCQKYNEKYKEGDALKALTWENCTMRSWLNGYGTKMNADRKDFSQNNFLDNAFSEEEQSAIKTTTVVNTSSTFNTNGGNDTSDKVYLPSVDEVTNPEYGFSSDMDSYSTTRESLDTAYAVAGGELGTNLIGPGDIKSPLNAAGNTERWWLRGSGDKDGFGCGVWLLGSIMSDVFNVTTTENYVVRPVLHLDLSADSGWSYAGTAASADVAEWDCVWFGNYWQEDTNGDGKADKKDAKTPIKWRVLSVEDDDVFLMSDKSLDCQKYNETRKNVTWENCTMRSWLNGYGAEMNTDGNDYNENNFINEAFSGEEQAAITTANVVNNDNLIYGTEGGNDTSDKVYLLSEEEARNLKYGFSVSQSVDSKTRRALNTAFAKGQGAMTFSGSDFAEYAGTGYWWLRSPGYSIQDACHMDRDGSNYMKSVTVNYEYGAVRPVLHLKQSLLTSLSYAGTVISNGVVEETEAPKPSVSPAPTEPANTGKSEETEEPSVSPLPTEPGSTQKLQETAMPGTTAQPGDTATPSMTPESTEPGKVGKVIAVKLKQKKRTVTVSWKKTTKANGYQICYSTSPKWKNKKQKLVSKNKVVLKKLKKKKTYYFCVRAYRLEGTKKVFGAWSSVKKLKIKK